MNEVRYASLSSGLLARKGTAKPAMRPQGFTHIEDLGWNDMGYAPQPEEAFEVEPAEHVPSSISALTPAPKPVREGLDQAPVVAQQRAIAESFDVEEIEDAEEVETVEAEPPVTRTRAVKAQVVTLPKREVQAAGKKAAFTLRLDGDRHLRLRLACAVTGRSAQQIVTTALDGFLASVPEVETMAQRVPAKAGTRS
jgi:hypothetical protein